MTVSRERERESVYLNTKLWIEINLSISRREKEMRRININLLWYTNSSKIEV